jgi:hypothetical protein
MDHTARGAPASDPQQWLLPRAASVPHPSNRSMCQRYAPEQIEQGGPMMNGMTAGMTLGMGIICLLVIIVLVLAAAALIKYLRS